jgi:hypothetical protein
MTAAQIADAFAQMQSHCNLLWEGYKEGSRDYEMVTAREVLYTLGFNQDQADEVLGKIAEAGFSYCLDPHIKCDGGPGERREYPSYAVCAWGVDQLKSRLDSVAWDFRK